MRVAIDLKHRIESFEREAKEIFGRIEGAGTRVIILHDSYKQLAQLNTLQDELFRQSLLCIEHGVFRAAHVMAWAAFMDFLEQKLNEDGLAKVRRARPKWSAYETIEEIRESIPEQQILDVARDVGLLSKSETKSLQGSLSLRNECAHPSTYRPNLNVTLGYVSGLLERLTLLKSRSL